MVGLGVVQRQGAGGCRASGDGTGRTDAGEEAARLSVHRGNCAIIRRPAIDRRGTSPDAHQRATRCPSMPNRAPPCRRGFTVARPRGRRPTRVRCARASAATRSRRWLTRPRPGDALPAPALVEELAPDWGFYIRSARELEKFRSPIQAIEVHDSAPFGRLFRLDGHFMTSEKDEFFCHENLVHMAALTHPMPRQALIIGGGDGGSAEELLKHPSMQSVTLCEIDAAVVDVARKHLAAVHRGAFDDPAPDADIDDGFALVRRTAALYDLIVLDLTDPGGAVDAAVHGGLLPRLRRAAQSAGGDGAARREPGRAPGARPRRSSPGCARRSRGRRPTWRRSRSTAGCG